VSHTRSTLARKLFDFPHFSSECVLMSAKHTPQRSPDQTRLSFSLSKYLREKLEIEAAKQKRSISNLIQVLLEERFPEPSPTTAETPDDQGKEHRAGQPAPPARTQIKYSGRSRTQIKTR
jgi:hypothetical protein